MITIIFEPHIGIVEIRTRFPAALFAVAGLSQHLVADKKSDRYIQGVDEVVVLIKDGSASFCALACRPG